MAYDFPQDLLDLQRQFFRLESAHDTSQEITDVAVKLNGHPWWENVDNRYEARMALRAAAREVL